MHQMRIPTTQVSSVMLRSKKSWKSEKRNVKIVKELSDENQSECHGIDPNLSKLEGDNPSF
jgi:hypothetical protein